MNGDVVPAPAPVVAGSIALLGGTFDPIHNGHLAIAEDARESLGVERVLFVPSAVPPHKPGLPVTPAGERLAMVRLAVAGNPAFEVSDVEVARAGLSYTVVTLDSLRAGGIVDPWFILSAEALAGFPDWQEPHRILELCRLAVVPRPGFEGVEEGWVEARFPRQVHRVAFLPGPLLPISGSVVRRRAAAGRSVRYLVPDAVAAFIAGHRLYQEPASASRPDRT